MLLTASAAATMRSGVFVLTISAIIEMVAGAPPGPSTGPSALEHPNNAHPNNAHQAHPSKMQMHPGSGPGPAHQSNQAVNVNQPIHDQGPVPAAATSYDSYSSYGGGGGNYGGGPEYNNDNYGFDCYGKKPALYGDANYDCRIYHVCQADGRSDTIKCPKWARFNNYLGICDWHFKVDNYCNPLPDYKSDSYGSGYQQNSGGYQQGGGGGY